MNQETKSDTADLEAVKDGYSYIMSFGNKSSVLEDAFQNTSSVLDLKTIQITITSRGNIFIKCRQHSKAWERGLLCELVRLGSCGPIRTAYVKATVR